MLTFPKTQKEWIIATAASLAGFFFGGAAVALVQRWMKKLLY
jgi:hypothetical protein